MSIGDRSEMSWNFDIFDTDTHRIPFDNGRDRPHTAPVIIGEHVLIGTRAIILKGVTNGDGAIVAAGLVVSRNVSNTIVAGIQPGRWKRPAVGVEPPPGTAHCTPINSRVRRLNLGIKS